MASEEKQLGQNIPKTGAQDSDVNVTIDDLGPEQKTELFKGSRELLFGRIMDGKSDKVASAQKRLFKFKQGQDEKSLDPSDNVRPMNSKKFKVFETYNATQTILSKNCYFEAKVCSFWVFSKIYPFSFFFVIFFSVVFFFCPYNNDIKMTEN